MPRNAEYLITAYGLVIFVLGLYVTMILTKLKKTVRKLAQLNQEKKDAQ